MSRCCSWTGSEMTTDGPGTIPPGFSAREAVVPDVWVCPARALPVDAANSMRMAALRFVQALRGPWRRLGEDSMTPDQGALALESGTCRDCGTTLPYQGVGRPRQTCGGCRPAWWPPLTPKEVPSGLSVDGLARTADPVASHLAAALPGKTTMKWRYLVALVDGGPQTDREVAKRIGVPYTTCGPRRPALIEAGFVEMADLPRRPTGDGGLADVYRATPLGVVKARELREAK